MKYPEMESQTLEFKREIPKNDQILRTMIGFCNQAGGRLIVGVGDDGTVIGIPEEKIVSTMEWLEKAIYEATAPPILPKVILQRIGEKLVLVIKVSSGMNKPYYRVSEGIEKGTYIRLGRSTIRANLDMIEELKWQSRGKTYDELPCYQAKESDLDYAAIQRFLKSRKQRPAASVTPEVLKSYQFLTEEHGIVYPTVAGILLFGKEVQHWLSEAMIICTHFAGTKGREAIATRDCTGNLFEQFHEAFEFILSRLNRSFTIRGPKREETLELPEVAVREILLNAIIHRNYHLRAPTKVAIWADRVEIFSPGNFPTPFPNLELGLTDLRNKVLCKVFREADYIEKLGTGLIMAFDSYRQANLPRPQVIDGENFVKGILPRESYAQEEVSDDLQPILRLYLSADSISVSEVIHLLQIPRATATRRLAKLVEMNLLKKVGQGKGTRYIKKR